MRRNRTKTKKNSSINRVVIILVILILLPVLSITIGYYGTKYILIPKFFTQETYKEADNTSDVINAENKDPENKGSEQVQNSNNNKTETVKTEEESLESTKETMKYSFETPPLSIYSVQVGSFADIQHAEKAIDDLKSNNLSGFIIKSNNTYKVLTKSFLDRENADNHMSSIKEHYPDSFILTKNIATKAVAYSESSKNLGQSLENEVKKLNNFYVEYYNFLIQNDSIDLDKENASNFLNQAINKLNDMEISINKNISSEELKSLHDNLLDIISTANTKLKDINGTDKITSTSLWNIFNEAVNKYISMV